MKGHGRDACVALHVDDTDAYYREWSPKVTVLRAPRDEEWGARTFDLLDPSGNTIFVMGPLSENKPDDSFPLTSKWAGTDCLANGKFSPYGRRTVRFSQTMLSQLSTF